MQIVLLSPCCCEEQRTTWLCAKGFKARWLWFLITHTWMNSAAAVNRAQENIARNARELAKELRWAVNGHDLCTNVCPVFATYEFVALIDLFFVCNVVCNLKFGHFFLHVFPRYRRCYPRYHRSGLLELCQRWPTSTHRSSSAITCWSWQVWITLDPFAALLALWTSSLNRHQACISFLNITPRLCTYQAQVLLLFLTRHDNRQNSKAEVTALQREIDLLRLPSQAALRLHEQVFLPWPQKFLRQPVCLTQTKTNKWYDGYWLTPWFSNLSDHVTRWIRKWLALRIGSRPSHRCWETLGNLPTLLCQNGAAYLEPN